MTVSNASSPAAKTLVMENTEKRDALIAAEKQYQKMWAEEKIFEINPPAFEETSISDPDELRQKYPKFFGTMAYPYMNGVLHAGHSFTMSKVEFQTGYERMLGKRALFPLGFHCTGMPIKACADKLTREIEMFGPNFENAPADDEVPQIDAAPADAKTDPTKFRANKSKAAAKKGRGRFQFEIMLQLGIPREEVKKFADPQQWLQFFPPKCKEDCDSFGARIDWRRSMVTTDANPYYDAFVRWQMRSLKALNKVKFGLRYTIYSAKDGQPCMDHDRQSGEGVNPQEYTGIKIQILEWPVEAKVTLGKAAVDIEGKKISMIAATLRPETMYGQTCCFVSPNITYGLYEISPTEIYICTSRAAKNMSFQKITPVRGEAKLLAEISGRELIGAKIHAPLSVYREVRVLPMDTILASKGTGVVTSVPSDSPDDYATVVELAKKADYYGIDKEWASLEPIPIITSPTYGDLTAVAIVKELKIQSPKDKELLAKAKEIAYKDAFYQGTMVIGAYIGEKVEIAKNKVKNDLIAAGDAFVYNEPESLVISRSGDECVVSLEDQWYIDYGEEEWKEQTYGLLEHMNTYSIESRHAFESVLDWLNNWACARSYGLGTRLPWDPQYLVESLSDSTVYMAYYTIAHHLHSDIFGKTKGLANASPEEMTDSVFDYIFTRGDYPKDSTIAEDKLKAMRREFEYFYPLDVRVSGKDLINNHLTFFMYTHVALFPEKYWPRGVRTNGHLLLNNEKMSKSTGNFMTLNEIVKKFGADCARISLADAGDSFEDANFDESNANAMILRLYTMREWCEDQVKNVDNLRTGPKDSFLDRAFENEMNVLVEVTKKNYDNAFYKAALKTGLYDFQAARDYYREATSYDVGMHKDLVLRYIEQQALLLTPIAPHWAEYIWIEVLKKPQSIQFALFPEVSKPVDIGLTAALEYVRSVARSIRETEGANIKKQKKGKPTTFDPKKPTKLTIYIALQFPEWQDKYLDLVQDEFDRVSLKFSPDLTAKVQKLGDMKRSMPFVNHLKYRLTGGKESPDVVFNRKLVFDEVETVKATIPILQRGIGSQSVEVFEVQDGSSVCTNILTGEEVPVAYPKEAEAAVPGTPGISLVNV
ncbi:hypothetical protein V1520DRAFT_305060 [Lipomyces starkeyi]|uniref:leucine--tRNA ligase n=1 Tax=Lipomyces starkeyi NRRL Y-11557 TaxID=675824 RepID=A0A1E3QEW7_LIPST|nr:hypothetical protein LIPSTDRAFT_84 [Lipomyces starkeyi NRRL Y-11557]